MGLRLEGDDSGEQSVEALLLALFGCVNSERQQGAGAGSREQGLGCSYL